SAGRNDPSSQPSARELADVHRRLSQARRRVEQDGVDGHAAALREDTRGARSRALRPLRRFHAGARAHPEQTRSRYIHGGDTLMAFVDNGDVKLFYTVDGKEDAPFLMLCNSLGTTHNMWDAQMAVFGEKFRVIRYDRRGHGQSSSPPAPYALADLAADALAVMDARSEERRVGQACRA